MCVTGSVYMILSRTREERTLKQITLSLASSQSDKHDGKKKKKGEGEVQITRRLSGHREKK